ncbi:MAG: hypothetical protein JW943_04675 [Deltaproteobacteria bacterium]|nr:hypothetical protein [Deltaproteobacteria bacterium]
MIRKTSFQPSPYDRYRITHECGHAIVWWFHGFLLLKVSVQDTEIDGRMASGHVKLKYSSDTDGGTTPDLVDLLTASRVYGLIAGRVATEIYCGLRTDEGCSLDFETVKSLIDLDPDTLKIYRWRQDHPGAGIEDLYLEFRKPVARLLRSAPARRAVRALSKAIDKARILSGAEAVAIIEKAWGCPLPPLAIPSEKHVAIADKAPQSYDGLIRYMKSLVMLMKRDMLPLRYSNDHIDRLWIQLRLLEFTLMPPVEERPAPKIKSGVIGPRSGRQKGPKVEGKEKVAPAGIASNRKT